MTLNDIYTVVIIICIIRKCCTYGFKIAFDVFGFDVTYFFSPL